MNPLAMKIIGALGVAIVMLVMWIGWTNAANDRDKAEKLAQDRLELIRDYEEDIEIYETAALQRRIDEANLGNDRQELRDAISIPTDSAADRKLRRRCVLRKQQRPTEGVHPACERFGGGSGASAP